MGSAQKPPEDDRVHLLVAQLKDITKRLEETEERCNRLENTLQAVSRKASGCSIGPACNKCGESRMLMEEGLLRCPECQYQRSL